MVLLWSASLPGEQTVGTLPRDTARFTSIAIARGARDGVIVVAANGKPFERVFVTENDGRDWCATSVSGDIHPALPAESLSSGRVALALERATGSSVHAPSCGQIR